MIIAQVDLTPLYGVGNQIIQAIAAGAVTALCGWAVYAFHAYLAPYLGTQDEAQIAANLNTTLSNGVAAGLVHLGAWETAHKDVEVRGAVQKFAVQYAVDHAPEAIAHFGLSPDQLAIKALAFIPTPPPSAAGTTGMTVQNLTVHTAPLPPP